MLISDSLDILCIAESKLDELFLKGEIVPERFEKSCRLDVFGSSGGLLIYVKTRFPSKIINRYDFQKDMQCIATELNAVNKKGVIFSIYRPPKQNINYPKQSIRGDLFLCKTL